jgi:hypothetical protein
MKHAGYLLLLSFLFIFSLSPISCSDSEPHLGQTAMVIIDLGLPDETVSANTSVIDYILNLITPRLAMAQTAPAVFSSITVRITASDLGSVEKTFPPYGSISLNVLSGKQRQFEVTASVAPGEPNAGSRFKGTAIVDLTAGDTVTLPVVMSVNETKIVVPDFNGAKIVMMDTIYGGNLVSRNTSSIFATARTLNPYDIDFDAHGRIYFANNVASSSGGIYRMENINSTWAAGTCVQLVTDTNGVRSISIDRTRNMLYYVDASNDLYKLNLNGGSPTVLISSSASISIATVCVDESSGILYISYMQGTLTQFPYICRYNPETPAFIPSAYPLNPLGLTTASDLIVKNGYLYACFITAQEIIQLPLNLVGATTPPSLTGKPGGNAFLGPHMFIAITNRKIYFIDEREGDGTNLDESIISFAGIDGSEWAVYPNTSGFFNFYSSC